MIKFFAAALMLVDHVGYLIFPYFFILRIIGRLSMPLYAYSVARGFFYSNQHGTIKRYILNVLLIGAVSQIPYSYITGRAFDLNICFTWFISLLLLYVATREYNSASQAVLSLIIASAVIFIPMKLNFFSVDYGMSGIFAPIMFYFLIKNNKEGIFSYFLVLLGVWGLYAVNHDSAVALVQFTSVFASFLLVVFKKYDRKIRLSKWFYYLFYPCHLVVLIMIKQFIFR